MSKLIGAGIINGKNENMLCPTEKVTRAEAAIMLKRFFENVK